MVDHMTYLCITALCLLERKRPLIFFKNNELLKPISLLTQKAFSSLTITIIEKQLKLKYLINIESK